MMPAASALPRRVVTAAPLTGSILSGITRESVLRLALELGCSVEEQLIDVDNFMDGIRAGKVTEAFGSGTAAVITPVGKLCYKTPEEELADPVHFLAHVMSLGTVEDITAPQGIVGKDDYLEVLEKAPPGIFDVRSWAYWNLKCGRQPAPPLPTRAKSLRVKSGKKSGGQPGGVTAHVQYGPDYSAWLVYLYNQQHLPLNRIDQMSFDLYGQHVDSVRSNYILSTEIYRGSTGLFETGPQMLMGRDYLVGTLLADNRGLIAGSSSVIETYNPASGSCSSMGGMTRTKGGHSTTLLADGRLLVAGGKDTAGILIVGGAVMAQIFGQATSRFVKSADPITPRMGPPLTVLMDGTVMTCGAKDLNYSG